MHEDKKKIPYQTPIKGSKVASNGQTAIATPDPESIRKGILGNLEDLLNEDETIIYRRNKKPGSILSENHFTELEKELKKYDLSKPVGGIEAERIPDYIFENLPEPFRTIGTIYSDKQDRDVVFLSSMVLISSILINCYTSYQTKITPHLFLWIIAQAGTGKGIASDAQLLVEGVEHLIREGSKIALSNYQKRLNDYEFRLANDTLEEGETKPEKPKWQRFFISGDNSQANITEQLADGLITKVMFEAEGDALGNSLSKEWGSFSPLLRVNFDGTKYTSSRKDGGDLIIPRLAMAILLTSTPDQLLKVIPDANNGLFSRFIFWFLASSMDWKDVKKETPTERLDTLRELGNRMTIIYDFLRKLDGEIEVVLAPNQDRHFNKEMQLWKARLMTLVSVDLAGTSNRLGVILHKLVTLFSAMRVLWDESNTGFSSFLKRGQLEETTGKMIYKIVCLDKDYEAAFEVLEIAKSCASSTYLEHLPGRKLSKVLARPEFQKLYEMMPNKFIYSDHKADWIEFLGTEDILKKAISTMTKKEILFRTKKNHYQKAKP